MNITATIKSASQLNEVVVSTEGNAKAISIPAKSQGQGSSVNGGELLFLALATCFGNDIYREAARRNMKIISVDVEVKGEFGKEGEPGKNITYVAAVVAPDHSQHEIDELVQYVDSIAEIHNTLRQGASVTLKNN